VNGLSRSHAPTESARNAPRASSSRASPKPGPLAPGMFRRAVRTALIVGTVLTLINQWQALLRFALTPGLVVRVAMNYAVPLAVSLSAMLGVAREGRVDGCEPAG